MIIKSRQTEIDSEVYIKIENEDGTFHLLERKERIKYQLAHYSMKQYPSNIMCELESQEIMVY